MATQGSVLESNAQFKSPAAVIPFPVPESEQITQLELITLISLKNRARQIDEEIEAAESSVRTRLEAGASVEAGPRTAELKTANRRNVSWKTVVERLADRLYGNGNGAAYCTRVLASTKPIPSVSLVLE